MFKKAFSKAQIVSTLLAAAILIGNTSINQTTAYAESAPVETEITVPVPKEEASETEEPVPSPEETAPEAEETAPEAEENAPEAVETAPETEETAPEVEETTPDSEEPDDFPQYNDPQIETYAASDFSYMDDLFHCDGITITGYNGNGGAVTIPHRIDGKSVTSISSFAFSGCTSLKSITIPSSVTEIVSETFQDCTGLTGITIPNSVTSIGDRAFLNCESLTSITISNSVTSIGGSAFSGCSSLTSVTIPSGVTKIRYLAFCDCKSLASITIPDSVTSIEDSAFSGCESLTSVTIPNSVTSIGWSAFKGCTNLKSLAIPNSVTKIGSGAFSSCESLTSITIPNRVTEIESGTFSWCSSLTSVTIPNGVASIGNSAFSWCSSLTSVTIPNSVTSIEDSAFFNCENLKSVTVLNSNTAFGNDSSFAVFDNVPNLTLYGKAGSTTEAYAKEENIPFVALDALIPALPAISVKPGNGQATVTWSAVNGAAKYRVFTYLNGKYTQAGETVSTSYVVSGLSGGTKYGFLVLAYNGSAWSPYNTALDVVYATPSGIAKPTFTVTAGKNQATVKWNAISGAKKYRLFTYLNGKYTSAGETTSTSYVISGLSGGTKYGFLVLAYDGSIWSSYNTALDVVYVTPSGLAKPAFTVTPGKNQATVKWNAVTGAKKYRLFTYLDGKYTQAGETTSTSYVVAGLFGRVKYGFLVLANDGSAWSPYNTALDVVYATPTGLTKPVFMVTPGKNQATVKWSAVKGATSYRVFTYLNGKFTKVADTTSTSIVVKALSGGVKYGFLVLANDGSGWTPYNTALDVVYATPTGIAKPTFTVTAGKNQATVKWSAVKGATSYRVFTYLNGKFTKVADTTSTSIVVKALSGGVKHGFLVVANDGSGWTPYNTALDVVYATPTGIAKPTFTVTAGKNQATIKWSAVKGAKSYRVFTYLNGKFTKVADTTSTSIVVKSLSGGVKYGFLVLANDGSGWTPYNTALDVVYATPSK